MTIRTGLVNITTSDKTIWNIIKNLFVPVWYADGMIDIQFIPIIVLLIIL